MRTIVSSLACLALLLSGSQAMALSLDLRGPTFEPGRPAPGEPMAAAISAGDEKVLQEWAEILERYPGLVFEIIGHTDPGECAGYECERLALRRAVAVFHYLLEAGVDPKRLVSLRQAASSRTVAEAGEDSRLNRRVEITLTSEP